MDDNADDLGDEEAAEKKRMEQLLRDDTAQTKAVMHTLTKGVRGKNQGPAARGRYTDKAIVAFDEEEAAMLKLPSDAAGGKEDEGDSEPWKDEEEMMQQEFMEDLDKLKDQLKNRGAEEDALSSESDSGEDGEEDEDLDSAEEAVREEVRRRRKEDRLAAKLLSKEYTVKAEKHRFFRRLESVPLSRQTSHATASPTEDGEGSLLPTTPSLNILHHSATASLVPSITHSGMSSLAEVALKAVQLCQAERAASFTEAGKQQSGDPVTVRKRRTMTAPEHVIGGKKRAIQRSGAIHSHSMRTMDKPAVHRSASDSMSAPLMRSVSSSSLPQRQGSTGVGAGRRADMYTAELDRNAIEQGFGMGMAVAPIVHQQLLRRKQSMEALVSASAA